MIFDLNTFNELRSINANIENEHLAILDFSNLLEIVAVGALDGTPRVRDGLVRLADQIGEHARTIQVAHQRTAELLRRVGSEAAA